MTNNDPYLQYFQRNSRTCLGICQGMMVILQVISATGGNDIESVMSSWPTLARRYAGTIKLIVRIVHLIDTKYGFQTTLVEGLADNLFRQEIDSTNTLVLSHCP